MNTWIIALLLTMGFAIAAAPTADACLIPGPVPGVWYSGESTSAYLWTDCGWGYPVTAGASHGDSGAEAYSGVRTTSGTLLWAEATGAGFDGRAVASYNVFDPAWPAPAGASICDESRCLDACASHWDARCWIDEVVQECAFDECLVGSGAQIYGEARDLDAVAFSGASTAQERSHGAWAVAYASTASAIGGLTEGTPYIPSASAIALAQADATHNDFDGALTGGLVLAQAESAWAIDAAERHHEMLAPLPWATYRVAGDEADAWWFTARHIQCSTFNLGCTGYPLVP